MSADLTSILAKLTDQGKQIAAQGDQIAKLLADRDAKEQSDLDQINALIDANGAASKGIGDKVTSALSPDSTSTSDQSTTSVSVTAPVVAGSTTIPVSGASTAPDVGSTVSGSAIAAGATVQPGSTASTIVLDQPTTADHTGDGSEQLIITPTA